MNYWQNFWRPLVEGSTSNHFVCTVHVSCLHRVQQCHVAAIVQKREMLLQAQASVQSPISTRTFVPIFGLYLRIFSLICHGFESERFHRGLCEEIRVCQKYHAWFLHQLFTFIPRTPRRGIKLGCIQRGNEPILSDQSQFAFEPWSRWYRLSSEIRRTEFSLY